MISFNWRNLKSMTGDHRSLEKTSSHECHWKCGALVILSPKAYRRSVWEDHSSLLICKYCRAVTTIEAATASIIGSSKLHMHTYRTCIIIKGRQSSLHGMFYNGMSYPNTCAMPWGHVSCALELTSGAGCHKIDFNRSNIAAVELWYSIRASGMISAHC